jgi:hypothetical protein
MGARVVATQAPTNRGDSGGPMVNSLGQVVGFAAISTTGNPQPKNSSFHEVQVTEFSVCVSEMRAALKDMRARLSAKQDDPPPSKTLVFQGQAKLTTHTVVLDKDVMYRLMVKTEGFVPEIRIDNILAPANNFTPGPNNELQHLFIPTETKEYRIQVGSVPGRDIGKGSAKYSFTVDQVAFEPETTVKGAELKLNEHVRKFEAGKAYNITVKGKGFEPDVYLADGTKTLLTKFNDGRKAGGVQAIFEAVGLTGAEFETNLWFVAPQTKDYRLLIAVSPFSPAAAAPRQYSIAITEQKVNLSVAGQLTAQDPIHRQAGPFKAHAVKLEAGKNYQIDLVTNAFDSHLLLEDAAGMVVAQGFDVDAFSSRLVFRPAKTDTYRVIATAHQVDARGAYTVTAAENPGAQPGPPRLNPNLPKNGK